MPARYPLNRHFIPVTSQLCITGRFSQENICPKRWKANFRCALKSLNDVVELQCCGQTRGKDAYRIYKFLSPGQLSKKRRGSSAHDDGAFKVT